MEKNIIFCADGTWNNPNQDHDRDEIADPTNVYKLFLCLDGMDSPAALLTANEQEKELASDGATLQIAKYIHGVGDSRNPIGRIIGGAFGAGIISRIVRGYTFISRNYEPGAKIFIVGFSRGAYTARALAGLIASEGVLAPALTLDKELAYRAGAEAWYQYRQKTAPKSKLARLWEVASDLPRFLSEKSLKATDFVTVDKIVAVAVWDTVGALGIPLFKGNGRVDAFRFCDTKLSKKVTNGFHAVSLDEQRDDFEPTLWDPAPNVKQVLFPGAHCDVGGGYPMARNENGLSDGGLRWMIDQLTAVGVRFSNAQPFKITPSHIGIAHKPWLHSPWNYPGVKIDPRRFPKDVERHPSIAARMGEAGVVNEPGEAAMAYDPASLSLMDAPETRKFALVS
jgi:uncharacterized protein (DUF2235 family)